MRTFKNLLLLSFVCFFFQAQAGGLDEVKSADELIWFGIDFTKVKCIEDEEGGFSNPNDIVKRMFFSWNTLFKSEPDKYDLEKIFTKNSVKFMTETVDEINPKTSVASLITEDTDYSISEDQIAQMVKKYKAGSYSGIGLVFIAEKLDKSQNAGTYHVTFFNIATREVLFSKKLMGKAGGFGFRNYWASSFHKVLLDCEKNYKKKW